MNDASGDTTAATEPEAPAARRLSDLPDWYYLLREYYEFYRELSAGGSPKIRAHQRAVRMAVRQVMLADPAVADLVPTRRPGHRPSAPGRWITAGWSATPP